MVRYCIRAVAARHFFTPTLLLGADTNDVADAVRTSVSGPYFAAFERGQLRLSETPLLTFASQISVFPRPIPCLAPLRFSQARRRMCFEDVLSREKQSSNPLYFSARPPRHLKPGSDAKPTMFTTREPPEPSAFLRPVCVQACRPWPRVRIEIVSCSYSRR